MRAVLVAALACGCWTGAAPAPPPVVSNAAPAPPAVSPPADAALESDEHTGFDLYVSQPGVETWKLDGETRTDHVPVRIRGIVPGRHEVEIDAPPGFKNAVQTVDVELGKAPKVMIELHATGQP
jgi:hypothetical protein